MSFSSVTKHYAAGGRLLNRIELALRGSGFDLASVTTKDLDAVDEFHLGGRATADKLFDLLSPEEGAQVLDVGAGLGGPARLLASRGKDVSVIGVDLTAEYVETANAVSFRGNSCSHRTRRFDA